MNLGLLDILTVQKADAPVYKKPEARAEAALPKGEKTFEERVNRENPESKARENFDSSAYKNAYNDIAATAQNSHSEFSLGKETGSDGTSSFNISATANEGEGLLSNEIGLAELFAALQKLKDSGFPIPPNSPVSALLALKESGDISFDASNQLQGVAGSSLLDLVKQVAQGNFQVDLVEGFENLDSALNSIKKSATDVVNNFASLSKDRSDNFSAIADAASSIIGGAKSDIESIDIKSADLKSEQATSLLKATQKIEVEGQKQPLVQPNAQNIEQVVASSLVKEGLKGGDVKIAENQIANKIENNEVLNNKLTQIENAVENAGKNKDFSGSKDQGSDSENLGRNSDLFAKTSLQNGNLNTGNTQDFIKFQKYLDSVSSANAGDKAVKSSPADVMAQIKFGISSSMGKNNGNITIQLHPKELGSVDVKMTVGVDGKTKIAVIAEKVETLNLLQKDASSLKDMLQDALQTSETNLSFSFHSNGDERWKEFLNDSQSGNNLASAEDDILPDLSNNYQYQQSFVASDGLDIRV